jgi:hypothetical protein
VKVDAIRQNRTCPVPLVTSRPSKYGENLTVYNSWLNALARSATRLDRHDQRVRR